MGAGLGVLGLRDVTLRQITKPALRHHTGRYGELLNSSMFLPP